MQGRECVAADSCPMPAGLRVSTRPLVIEARAKVRASPRVRPVPSPQNNNPTPDGGPQARRLEELDKVYRDEVLARKRAHNALEDAKGKIRVFARIRPLLEFEAARKQQPALAMPDELTVAHPWRDEKKPREYSFDGVFGADVGQDAVGGKASRRGGWQGIMQGRAVNG